MPRTKRQTKTEESRGSRIVTRSEVVRVVISKVGRPYAEQGRTMARGYDCIGVFTSTGLETGCHSFEFMGYSNRPDGKEFEQLCDKHLIRLADNWQEVELRPADLLAVDKGKGLQHLSMVITVLNARRHLYEVCDSTRELGGVRRYPFRHPFTEADRIIPYRIPGLIDG